MLWQQKQSPSRYLATPESLFVLRRYAEFFEGVEQLRIHTQAVVLGAFWVLNSTKCLENRAWGSPRLPVGLFHGIHVS